MKIEPQRYSRNINKLDVIILFIVSENDLIDAKRKGMEKAFMDWNKDTENRFKFSSKEVLQYLWDKDYDDKTVKERGFVKDIMRAFIKSNNGKIIIQMR